MFNKGCSDLERKGGGEGGRVERRERERWGVGRREEGRGREEGGREGGKEEERGREGRGEEGRRRGRVGKEKKEEKVEKQHNF